MAPSRSPPAPPSVTNGAPKGAIKGFSLPSSSSKGKTNGNHAGLPQRQPLQSSLGSGGTRILLSKHPRDQHTPKGRGFERDSDDSGDENRGRHEEVTGFEAGGAVRKGEDRERGGKGKGLLVIPKLENKDFRGKRRRNGEEIGGKKRGKNLLPAEVQAQRAAEARREGHNEKERAVDVVDSADIEGEVHWGLSVPTRRKYDMENGDKSERSQHEKQQRTETQPEQIQEKSQDQLAIDALLGESSKPKEDLIIAPASPIHHERMTEADAYRAAVVNAPNPSTLEDYERVPVEEFGAALLRGMGWDGEVRGKTREVRRRGNLVGLGAKEEGLKEVQELGAWVGGSWKGNVGKESGKGKGQGNKMEEYRRERERRRERREGGGGESEERSERYHAKDRDRDKDGYRSRVGDRDREWDRRRDGDRERYSSHRR